MSRYVRDAYPPNSMFSFYEAAFPRTEVFYTIRVWMQNQTSRLEHIREKMRLNRAEVQMLPFTAPYGTDGVRISAVDTNCWNCHSWQSFVYYMKHQVVPSAHLPDRYAYVLLVDILRWADIIGDVSDSRIIIMWGMIFDNVGPIASALAGETLFDYPFSVWRRVTN